MDRPADPRHATRRVAPHLGGTMTRGSLFRRTALTGALGLAAAAALAAPSAQAAPVTHLIPGGDAILVSGARCSLGFNVRNASNQNFFLTAGHCTNIGATWRTSSGQLIGSRVATSFPGNDYGVVQYTGTVTASGTV